MKSILILGGSGFIGHALYKELGRYYNTYATYHTAKGFASNQHFYPFHIEQDDPFSILKDVKPKLIISALRGDFEALLETHSMLDEFVGKSNCRILFLSSANVFDAFQHFPSYEYDKTLSESVFGRFKIKIENSLMRMPPGKSLIARLPMIFGRNAPRAAALDEAVIEEKPIEVFPNTVVNVNEIGHLCRQIHYMINQKCTGIYHLGSHDLVTHFDFMKSLAANRHKKEAIFKRIYTSNEMRYLAVLPKKNRLPEQLQISYTSVLEDSSLPKSASN